MMEPYILIPTIIVFSALIVFFTMAVAHHKTLNIFKFRILKYDENQRISLVDWFFYKRGFKEFNVGDVVFEKQSEYERISGKSVVKFVIVDKSDKYYKMDVLDEHGKPVNATSVTVTINNSYTVSPWLTTNSIRNYVWTKINVHKNYELCKESIVKNDTAELLR